MYTALVDSFEFVDFESDVNFQAVVLIEVQSINHSEKRSG
jgi:hypothetical protein